MSLSGWIYLGSCIFKFFESMFSVSTHSSVTSMISVVSGSSHSASETGFCTLALLLDMPPPVIHLARLSFCIGCMYHALYEDPRVFMEQAHFPQCC